MAALGASSSLAFCRSLPATTAAAQGTTAASPTAAGLGVVGAGLVKAQASIGADTGAGVIALRRSPANAGLADAGVLVIVDGASYRGRRIARIGCKSTGCCGPTTAAGRVVQASTRAVQGGAPHQSSPCWPCPSCSRWRSRSRWWCRTRRPRQSRRCRRKSRWRPPRPSRWRRPCRAGTCRRWP